MKKPESAYYYSINIGNSGFQQYKGSKLEVADKISGLSRLNFFVGANNSGKSRLMREIIKEKKPNGTFTNDVFDWSLEQENVYNRIMESQTDNARQYFDGLNQKISGMNVHNVKELRRINDEVEVSSPTNKIYIPLLRGLWDFKWADGFTPGPLFRLFSDKPQDDLNNEGVLRKIDLFKSYFERTYTDKLGQSGATIFTGLNLYSAIKQKLLGSESDREEIRKFQDFLSKNFFAGKKILLLPKEGASFISIKIGDDPDRAIFELGDGVQNIIVISYVLYTNVNSLIFIEEPENTIHPGLQRRLIEVLLSSEMRKRGHQYFVTTHSNHLLDLTLEHRHISIYRLSPLDNDGRKLIQPVDPGDFSILRELGIMSSSVFLANFTLWVEGVSDRLYLSKILSLYQEVHKTADQRMIEDIDYTFVEYGGDNIEHWSFVEDDEESGYPLMDVSRIASEGALVADDDGARKGSKKLARHKLLKKNLGKRFIKLPVREIENILSPKSLNDGIKSYSRKSSGAVFFDEGVKENINYRKSKIGDFIDKNIYPDGSEYSFSNKGTLKDKLNFALAVTESMTYNDLTNDAKKIAENLYQLILEQKKSRQIDEE